MARSQAVELPERVANEIADLAKLPLDQSPAFSGRISELFVLACKDHNWDEISAKKRDAAQQQLPQLLHAAAALKACLDGLDVSIRKQLGMYALRQELFGPAANDEELRFQIVDLLHGGWLNTSEIKLAFFRKVIDDICVAADTREWPPRDGTPSKWFDLPGNPNVTAYDLFVVRLEQLVLRHGGRTTLHKNAGTGTSFEILRAAAQCLPAGLIPKAPSPSRLQRLKTLAVRLDKNLRPNS